MNSYSTLLRHVVAIVLVWSAHYSAMRTLEFTAPNLVAATPKIITSGQPTADALQLLGTQKFDAVVFLVPDGTSGNVKDEAAILKRQGIHYLHIPIPFGAPTAQHYHTFADAMSKLTGKKVLVHCEINLRASSMVFLYRTTALKEDPDVAYASVVNVWSPRGAWKPYIETMLSKHKIKFATF